MSEPEKVNNASETPSERPAYAEQTKSAQQNAEPERNADGFRLSRENCRRTPQERAYDLRLMEQWYVKGATIAGIIEKLKAAGRPVLSRAMVCKELKRLQRQWESEALDLYDEEMRRSLRALRHQEEELWAAWERSKQDATKQSASQEGPTKDGKDGANGKQRKAVTKESQNGDPAYMRLILEVQEQRAKLLGLYAAKKQEITGRNGGPIDVTATVAEVDLPGAIDADEAKKLMQRHYERINGRTTNDPDISGANVGASEGATADWGGVADSSNSGSHDSEADGAGTDDAP